VVQNLTERADNESRILNTVSQEVDLLNRVLEMDYEKFDRVEEKALNRLKEGEIEDDVLQPMNDDNGGIKRKQSKMSSLSGSGNNYYVEK
jgi:hypothetical protein